MQKRLAGLALLAAMAAGSAGLAKPVVLICEVAAGGAQGGIVTPRYMLAYEPGSRDGQVFDGLIKHEIGDAISMTVTGDTPKRTDFSWTLNAKDPTGVVVKLLYKATWFKANKSFVVAGTVGGGTYRGGAEARGSCAPQ